MTEKQRKEECKKCVHCDEEYLTNNTEGCCMFHLDRKLDCCDSFKGRRESKDAFYDGISQGKYAMCVEMINFINQLKEEYNNGWIPIEEGLPEEHKLYDITFRNSVGIHSDSAIFIPSIRKWFWDADETEFVENEILAWAEKREPYQPKGE